MLVCGSQLWWNLPWIGEDGPLEYYWYFPTSKNTKCLATFIKHPSRFMVGINSKPSKEIFQKLISYESI